MDVKNTVKTDKYSHTQIRYWYNPATKNAKIHIRVNTSIQKKTTIYQQNQLIINEQEVSSKMSIILSLKIIDVIKSEKMDWSPLTNNRISE